MGAVLLRLCFLLANDLASFHTSNRTQSPPRYAHTSFSQDGFQCEGLWEIDSTYYGAPPSSLLTTEEPFCTRAVREVSLTSRMIDAVILSLCSSRAQLLATPPLTFSLNCQEETSFNLLSLTNASYSAQGPIYLLPHLPQVVLRKLDSCM